MKNRSILASAIGLVLVAALAGSPVYAAAPKERLFSLHRANVDVARLADEVARITGKSMIISPTVMAVVTLDTKSPVSADELFEAFVRVLNEKGLRVTQSPGGVIRISTQNESLGLTWT